MPSNPVDPVAPLGTEGISRRRVVLVAEDGRRYRTATRRVRAAAFEVTTCSAHRAAFAAVCALQPDLLILDVPGDHRVGWPTPRVCSGGARATPTQQVRLALTRKKGLATPQRGRG
jgi:DNA-binding response OmpR family regulator